MSTRSDPPEGAEESGSATKPSLAQTFGLTGYAFTPAKWAVLIAAGLMVTTGLVVSGIAPGQASAPTQSNVETGLLSGSFAESAPAGGSAAPAESQPDALHGAWSGFLVKGGFGLFLGFALGFAIRAFLRLALVMVGLYALALTLMAYAGWIEVHWDVMEQQFNLGVATLSEQFTSFKAFLSGILPASSMTAVGLAMGLKKR